MPSEFKLSYQSTNNKKLSCPQSATNKRKDDIFEMQEIEFQIEDLENEEKSENQSEHETKTKVEYATKEKENKDTTNFIIDINRNRVSS